MPRQWLVLPTFSQSRVSIHPNHDQRQLLERALREAGSSEREIANILNKNSVDLSLSEIWARRYGIDPTIVQDLMFTATLNGEQPASLAERLNNTVKTLSSLIDMLKDHQLGVSEREAKFPITVLLQTLKQKAAQSLRAKNSPVQPPKLPPKLPTSRP